MSVRLPPPLVFPSECCRCGAPSPDASFILHTDIVDRSTASYYKTGWRRSQVPICLVCKQQVYAEEDGRLWRYLRKILIVLGSTFIISLVARAAMSKVEFYGPLYRVYQVAKTTVDFLGPIAMGTFVIILIPAAFIRFARREDSDRYQMFIFRKLAGYDWKGNLRFGNPAFAAKVRAMNPERYWRS